MVVKILSPKLDFSDVLIVPKKSHVSSRSFVKLNRTFTFKYSNKQWNGVPIISSNMDTVTSVDTFNILKEHKMLSCFPKKYNNEWIEGLIPNELDNIESYCLCSGINKRDLTVLDSLLTKLKDNNIVPDFVCFDVANGYMNDLIKTCYNFRLKHPNITTIAGNVVTQEGVRELVTNGIVDIVKTGIGSSALCTTRKITGVGYPQFSAVVSCSEKAHELGAHIISDGGVNFVGDISKAFCGGADFVMLGSFIAGHIESPGEVIVENGVYYKLVYGMSSKLANEKYSGGLGNYKAAEGKVVKLLLRGNIDDTLQKIEGGLRSTCSYIGVDDISLMNVDPIFIQVNRQYNNVLDKNTIEE